MQHELIIEPARLPDMYNGRDVGQIGASSFGMPLADILGIARKRKWLLIGSVVAALALGVIITLLMTPKYTATTTLEIQRETRNFTNVEGVDSRAPTAIDPEFYETQAGLLRSSSLADSVAIDMRLQDNSRFFEMFGSRKTSKWFANGRLIPNESTREERLREASDVLLANVKISIQRLSRIAAISFTSPDAAFSKRVADSWVSHFIRATLDRRYSATSYARKFLEDRLGQLRNRINQTESALVDYAARQGIVNLPSESNSAGTATGSPERSLVAEDLIALNKELASAVAARIEAQSRLGAQGGDVQEALANTGISQMRANVAQLSSTYTDLLQRFDPNYPPALAVKAQMNALNQAIEREEGRVRSTLQRSYVAARARETDLGRRVERLKADLFDMRRRSTQYNILQREVDTNRQLYDSLLQRYKEIGVAGGVGVNNIAVIDTADLPDRPSSPRLWLNLAIALLLGAFTGAALALILEQFEDSLSDPAEVPSLLGVPLIGVVPRVASDPLVAISDPKSALSEAYFSVKTSLALATTHGFPRTIVVTSSRAGEGKSLTSYSIAKTLASSGKSVLLIDADMRSPSVHHLVECSSSPGLSGVLSGATVLAAAIRSAMTDNLWVITAGAQPPSAAELLSGERFGALLRELAERFDHVIVDAPPVMGFADAPQIAIQVEAICFVIEAHGTSKSSARSAIARLRNSGSMMCGAVVTKFDVKRAHYGYGYSYGYGYGYGDTAVEVSASGSSKHREA